MNKLKYIYTEVNVTEYASHLTGKDNALDQNIT